MYSRTTLGNYYPIKSIIHKLNPVNKIICLVLFILFIMFSMSLKLHFVLFAFLALVMLLSNVPFRFYFNILFSLRYILVILIILLLMFTITPDLVTVIVLKILMTVILVSVLTFTTSPSELAYGIEKFIKPFNLFNINFSKLIQIKVNAIRFIPTFITTQYSVLKAVEARGINYSYSNLLSRFHVKRKMFGSVYALTKRKFKNIKNEAMLRMFNYKKYRTNYKVNKFGFYDLVYTFVFLSVLYVHMHERGIIDALLVKLNL